MAPEEIYFRKGRSELALGRMDDAKASFEAALDANPSDSEAREYLDYVTSQLGQGEHDSIRRPIEAVAVPESILAPAAPSREQTFEDFGVYCANRVRAIVFRANEEYRRTDRYVIHITDQKAVSPFSSLAFEFSPRYEMIFVNELRVTDQDGKTVSTGDVSTYYVTDDTSDNLATSDKLLNIPIAGLEPGHTLHLTVTRQYTSPPETMPFIRHTFSLRYPTLKSSRDLRVEETLTLHGYYAAWLRSALKSNDSATQKRQIQGYMRAEANAVVQSVSTENLGEPRQPLVLHLRYRLEGAFYEADRTLIGKVPAIWERTFLDVAPSEERQTPFHIEYPVRVESEVTVTVPDGYRVASSPNDAETRSAWAEWKVTTTQSGPELALRSRGFRPSGDDSAEEFPEYVSTMSSLLASFEGAFVLERTN